MRSFWVVPASFLTSTPRSRARATYSDSSHMAVPLIVIDVFIFSSGISSKRTWKSSSELIGTPTLPTSGRAMRSSESYPHWVARSKAMERPVCPLERFAR